ncbi:hypothetical protein ASPBRDRAFT_186565 [Aspergillus brasiliensis CBS 101740]|uniref:Helicase C-terminal domain-containing protein n=1 Tax=Aspergillus brasiliensis (strain CBS 101740 / IMI 381727 / IBT 21946) TaxID=767769 RepID=A0A1L9U6L1_ASPBC|nr:hypothetical protein ASPBRDRAFT_186565 [Aspergillus brasiliensis CBS 101740]
MSSSLKRSLSASSGLPTRPSKRRAQHISQSDSTTSDSEEECHPDGLDPRLPEVVRSQLPSGTRAPRTQLALHLPPLHDLDEIFKSITEKAMVLNFGDALAHLGSRPLRIATVCSGTESPILALEMVQKHLRENFDIAFEIRHLFSAEIDPVKQAYIERNFRPPRLFRDVRELKNRVAQTAYGSLEKIPKHPDILVAGFSCVDFSNLNNKRKTLSDKGESGGTFWAIVRYAKAYRPPLVVLENVKSAPWKKIKEHWDKIGYFAMHIDVDTKAYYLPQTRERGYMLCADKNALDKHESAWSDIVHWAHTMTEFKRPASSPAGMFLIDADDKRLEKIETDMATRIKLSRTTVNWEKYELRHQTYRLNNNLGNRRPISKSQDDGSCQMPDFFWKKWVNSLPERIWETLDMNFLRKLVEGYDMNFKERCIELSQGIEREIDMRAPGIVGCITPSGIPYISTRGGPLCGLESLALQGLPLDRLLLTRETQRELQELAGNAMSSTVVGAAILSALIHGYKILKPGAEAPIRKTSSPKSNHVIPQDEHMMTPCDIELNHAAHLDLMQLQEQATSSARYCVCEGQTTTSSSILRCTLCQHTVCSECGGNPSHAYERCAGLHRTMPLDFVSELKRDLPARLVMSGISSDSYASLVDNTALKCPPHVWKEFLDKIEPAVGDELRLLDIKRSRIWTVLYEGKYSHLRLLISASSTEWLFFAKPPQDAPAVCLIREILAQPIARMTPVSASLLDGEWKICAPLSSKSRLYFSGLGPRIASYEVRCGLQSSKVLSKTAWTKIQVDGPDSAVAGLEADVRGTYDLLPDCGTANGSLHKRSAGECNRPVYLFLDPTKLGDPNNDFFVFAWDHERVRGYERRRTIAEVSNSWRSVKARENPQPVQIYARQWIRAPDVALSLYLPHSPISCHKLAAVTSITTSRSGCQDANIALLSFKAPPTAIGAFWKKETWEVINPLDSPSSLQNLSWLLQKAAVIRDFENWNVVVDTQAPVEDTSSVCTCVPSKPRILWGRDGRGWIKAYEDPYDAALYERQVKSRPPPFLIFRRIDEQGLCELRVTLNVQSLLHQACDKLAQDGVVQGASFWWRLVPNSYDTRNVIFPKFKISSNRNDVPSLQPPNFRMSLRPEQLRSLGWMIRQEDVDAPPFTEEETEEALLPSLMWRAEGRVTSKKTVRGGILADDVGYGKTAITLGLIDMLHGRDHQPTPADTDGFIPCKATLIIVPQIMLQQWQAEISKFLGSRFRVLVLAKAGSFSGVSINDILQSDIILVSWSVFNNPGYYEKLQKFTGTPKAPKKAGRNFDSWFKDAQAALKEQVRVLTNQGPSALLASIRLKRQTVKGSQTKLTYCPSRRLRGEQYVKKNEVSEPDDSEMCAEISSDEESETEDETDIQKLRSKTDQYLKIKSDEKAELQEPSVSGPDEDTQYEDSSTEHSEVRPGTKAVGQKARKWNDRKEFNIDKSSFQNWGTVKTPFLHAFAFDRLVIDEFTYADPERLCPLLAIKAQAKWVLSGTPPLNDFADVNTIAPFLDVHLGVDEEDRRLQNRHLKLRCNQRSAAEAFQSFRAPYSELWHRRRHELAQNFLDRFARRNVAEIDEIPSSEHIIVVEPSPAERVIYLELYKQLMTYNRRLRRSGRGKFSSDQVDRLNEFIGSSATAEEALLKRCSSFSLKGGWDEQGKPELTTCASLIATREKQLDILKSELNMKLKLAAWLHCRFEANYKRFHKFIESIVRDNFGDMTITQEVYPLLKDGLFASKPDDWEHFFAAPGEHLPDDDSASDEVNDNEISESVANESPDHSSKPKGARDSDQPSPAKRTSGSKRPKKSNEKAEGLLPKKPTKACEADALLGEITKVIQGLIAEWVLRKRALRFLTSVHLVLTGSGITQCNSCFCQLHNIENTNILGSCGHVLCTNCASGTMQKEQCIVHACTGSGKHFNVIKASTLGEDKVDLSATYGGTKLDKLVELINGIPSDERVLVFVQYPELIEVASKALELAKIKHTAVLTTDRKSMQKIEEFQKTSFGEDKVLILNLGGEMAAGLNLQSSNHVIFFSPMNAVTQYDYDSAMVQAIGRARRYGQTRHVHIYHILAKCTIDVNIFQERREKVLIEKDGKAELVSREEALGGEGVRCEGPSLVVDNAF